MGELELTMILRTGSRRKTDRVKSAFTLIELILVMTILIVVVAMSGSSLTSFFKGRALDAEGQRFLALTRHAQDRAVSEGRPMSLWIDAKQRKYGLEIAPGFAELDAKADEFELGRDLKIEVRNSPLGAIPQTGNEVTLRFNPDGFLNEATPETIVIKEKAGESVLIVPARNRLNYEITTNQSYIARR